MKKRFFGILAGILIGVASLAPAPAYAADCSGTFLGFKAWYDGIPSGCDADGTVKAPVKDSNGNNIKAFVGRIILNVLFDLSLAIGYFAVAMVIYGGLQYIMSNGDPGKAGKAKHTLSSAVIGVVIAMSASVLVNTLTYILTGTYGVNGTPNAFDAARLQGVFDFAYGMGGLIAVIFIIKSGFDYMLSQGDPGKTQKATRGIIYAVIGLVVVILAAIITSFVISNVGKAV